MVIDLPLNVTAAGSLTFSPGIGSFLVGTITSSNNMSLTDTAGVAINLALQGGTGTYYGTFSGAGSLTVNGVCQILAGTNTYQGTTTIQQIGILEPMTPNALPGWNAGKVSVQGRRHAPASRRRNERLVGLRRAGARQRGVQQHQLGLHQHCLRP